MARGKNGTKTNGSTIHAAERQRQALELRKAGASLQVIADRLGYAGPQGAHEAIRKGIAAIPFEAAEQVRAMELERCDRMQLGLYERATKGDEKAIDRVLRIMDRRAKLLGLDHAPKDEGGRAFTVTINRRNDVDRKPESIEAANDP